MSSLPTPYRLKTIISHPRPLPVGLGGTLNSLVDPVINSPCQGPSSPSQVPRGTPVGPDTATFKRFESQFRRLCAILGKSLWPAVPAGSVWPAHHETSSQVLERLPGAPVQCGEVLVSSPPRSALLQTPPLVCPVWHLPPRGLSPSRTSKVTPFHCGLSSAPPSPGSWRRETGCSALPAGLCGKQRE